MPGVFFRGSLLVRPQAASYADDTALGITGAGVANTVAVLGVAQRGQPNTAIVFTDPQRARLYYGLGGYALGASSANVQFALPDGIERAFASGASRVIGVRVGAGTGGTAITAATLNLTKSATTLLTVSTKEWGTLPNTWQLAVGAGTTTGQKLTLTIDDGSVVVVDNVYRNALVLRYIGAGTSPNVTISASQLSTAVTGGSAGDANTLAFATYQTLQQLVQALNATGKWSASLGAGVLPQTLATTLDQVTAQSVSTSAPGTNVTANVQAVADALNGPSLGGLLTATVQTTAGPVDTLTYLFTGGSDAVAAGGATLLDWTNAFTVLQAVDAPLVVPMSDLASVHAAAAAHCVFMSGVTGRRERLALVGGVGGETDAQIIARANALNNDRVVLFADGPRDPDRNGLLTIWPPYYLAATMAGQLAGLPDIAEPLTRKFVNVSGIERKHLPADIDTFLQGGVVSLEYVDGRGYRITQGITTSQTANFVHREISVRRGADYVSRTVREALDAGIVGRKGGPQVVAMATSITTSVLERMLREGVIVGMPGAPAYTGLSVSLTNDTMIVNYQVAIAIPVNYVLITAHLTGFATPAAI